jgi:tRNA(adenine34) deaminase
VHRGNATDHREVTLPRDSPRSNDHSSRARGDGAFLHCHDRGFPDKIDTLHPAAQSDSDDRRFMGEALRVAQHAQREGDVPVGAVVVLDGRIVGLGRNRREVDADPAAHAEIVALRQACRALGRWRVDGATLYVTLEPCPMCAGALVNARVARLVYGADDPKAGAARSLFRLCDDARLNHRMGITAGVMAEPCAEILQTFFKRARERSRTVGGRAW